MYNIITCVAVHLHVYNIVCMNVYVCVGGWVNVWPAKGSSEVGVSALVAGRTLNMNTISQVIRHLDM